MRVAIFTPFFAAGSELDSGIGVHFRDLALGLKENGKEVVVFHVPYETSTSKFWSFEGIAIHSIGLKTPRIPKIKGIGTLCRITRFFDFFEVSQLFLKTKLSFYKAHSLNSFDIIEASSNRGVAFGASTLKNRPPIFTRVSTLMKQVFENQTNNADLDYRLTAKFEEKQIQNSEYLVTHTHKHANEVSKILNFNPKRFKIIPHGICVEQINHEKTTNSSTKDVIKVLFVGRLEQRKGFDTLIQSIPEVIKKYQKIHFDICGTGELLTIAKSELPESALLNVSFHGYLPRGKLDYFYSNCDIFVAPSRYESFGIIYLEAMNFSKPIVACKTGGTPEVVLDGLSGILIEPNNSDQLSHALLKLINNHKLRERMGNNGKKHLLNKFSINTLIDLTAKHYRQGISNKFPEF